MINECRTSSQRENDEAGNKDEHMAATAGTFMTQHRTGNSRTRMLQRNNVATIVDIMVVASIGLSQ